MRSVPKNNKSSRRTIYMLDSAWREAQKNAEKLNMSVSKLLTHLITEGAHKLSPPKIDSSNN